MALAVPVSVWSRDADLEERVLQLKEKSGGRRGVGLLLLAFSALGVVYGDIGTSPLYAYGSIYPNGAPENDDNALLGSCSTIFWTITSIVLVKYVLLMLAADDSGEGGIIALYSLIKRAAGIRTVASTHATDLALKSLRGSRIQQTALLVVVLLAVNMIISDGVLTPAISVISAVQGIQYNAPISNGAVVGVTCAILVALFAIQGFGTNKISFLFSPVLLLWFISNAAIGFYNIFHWSPSVWKALSPSYMYYFWAGDAHTAWINLGAVMLSITGAEALYADLGHFNARAIQLSFLMLVYPSLTITYLGQTAYLLAHPADAPNTFWASVPRPVYWPMVVLATAAAIIASQALITGSFSIVRQGMAMSCFPRLTVRQTNEHYAGQIYIPEINYALMIACLIIVAAFQNATNIGNAYGLAIITVMVLDTSLLALVMILAWEWNALVVAAFWVLYTFVSAAYLSSNLNKVPHGAWFSIMLAGILSIVSFVYHYGQTVKGTYIEAHAVPLADLFEASPDGGDNKGGEPVRRSTRGTDSDAGADGGKGMALTPGLQRLRLVGTKLPVARVPGVGIYYSELLSGVPPVLVRFLSLAPTIHEAVVFLTIRHVPVPTVFRDEQLLIRKLEGFEGFFHAVVRYGYMDKVEQGPEFVKLLMEEIIEYLQSEEGLRELASTDGGDSASEIDLEVGYGGGTPPRLPSGDAHVAHVQVDPTASLSSAAGRKMLREISSRLQGRSATDTVTSAGSVGSRRGMVAVTMPLDGASGSAAGGVFSHPWVQQPSVLRRVRMTAIRERGAAPEDGRALAPADSTRTMPAAMAARFRAAAPGLSPHSLPALGRDSTVSVPLPPPPPRPRIYRATVQPSEPGSPRDLELARQGSGAGLRSRRAASQLPPLAADGLREDVAGDQESASATLSYQAAARLREQLAATRHNGGAAGEASAEQDASEREQQLVLSAYSHGVVHLLGSSQLHVPDARGVKCLKAIVLNSVYQGLVANTRPAAAAYNLPRETLLQIGVTYEV